MIGLWWLLLGPGGTIMLIVTVFAWLRVGYLRRRLRRLYRYGY